MTTLYEPTDVAGQPLNVVYAEDIRQLVRSLTGVNDPGPLSLSAPISAPASAPTVALQAGGVTGTGYQWSAYWITGTLDGTGTAHRNGVTLLGTATTAQAMTSREAACTAPASPPTQAIGWGLCRTKSGGGAFYVVAEAFLASYGGAWPQITDNTPDSGLATAAPNANTTGTSLAVGGQLASGTTTPNSTAQLTLQYDSRPMDGIRFIDEAPSGHVWGIGAGVGGTGGFGFFDHTAGATRVLIDSNGNLSFSGLLTGPSTTDTILSAQGAHALYLNYYGGTGGVYIGNGASGASGTWFGANGSATFGTGVSIPNGYGLTSTAGAKLASATNGSVWQAYPANSSSVGFQVWGLASQLYDLQEWLNSSGTVLAKVDASGNLTAQSCFGMNGFIAGPDTDTTAFSRFSTNNAANKGLVIRGVVSQSADLQQWQNSAGTVLAKVDASGNFTAQVGTFGGQISSTLATGTAPLSVASTTMVASLNADLLHGATPGTGANQIVQRDANANVPDHVEDGTAFNSTQFAGSGGGFQTYNTTDTTVWTGTPTYTKAARFVQVAIQFDTQGATAYGYSVINGATTPTHSTTSTSYQTFTDTLDLGQAATSFSAALHLWTSIGAYAANASTSALGLYAPRRYAMAGGAYGGGPY